MGTKQQVAANNFKNKTAAQKDYVPCVVGFLGSLYYELIPAGKNHLFNWILLAVK